MEYDPKQLEILIHKVAFTLGSNLEGLLFQQKNILDNQLNNLMINHNGQAESITPDEIVGAYEIATIHNGHPSYFFKNNVVTQCNCFSTLKSLLTWYYFIADMPREKVPQKARIKERTVRDNSKERTIEELSNPSTKPSLCDSNCR